jgi:uncharacterized protein YkwD
MARGGLLGRSLGGDGLVSARLMEMAWHPQQGRKGGDAPADPSVRMAGGCYTAHSSELSLIRSMNGARRARGMPRLRSDAQLAKVARKHTREMIDNGQPFHTAPPTLSRRVTRWLSLGENVGRGQTAVTLHRAFMGSPTHRANILNPRFRYVGVGTVQHDGRLWVTVNFERRRDPGTTLPPSC